MQLEATSENFKQIIEGYSSMFNQSGFLEKIIPRNLKNIEDLHGYTKNLLYSGQNNDIQGINKGISIPIWDLLDRGGKRWRPILCILLAESFGSSIDYVGEIAALCEIIHNGTLMVDDIEDQSEIRRGKKCIHLIYGVDVSVNTGNFMYFAPLQYVLGEDKFSSEQKLKFSQIYAQEMTALHLGQCWDIIWHNPSQRQDFIPSENQYLQMTAHKTGVLARLSVRLICASLNLSIDYEQRLSRFAERIGVAFQIQDDILNLVGEQYTNTKGQHGEDIHEGKMSLMVIHTLQTAQKEKSKRLEEIIKMKTNDQNLINEAIQIILDSGSIEYCKSVAEKLISELWTSDIGQIIPEGRAKLLIKLLAEYTIGRNI